MVCRRPGTASVRAWASTVLEDLVVGAGRSSCWIDKQQRIQMRQTCGELHSAMSVRSPALWLFLGCCRLQLLWFLCSSGTAVVSCCSLCMTGMQLSSAG